MLLKMAANPSDPGMARLLGASFEGGEVQDFNFGIPKDFMQKVISQVGNYGEVYDKHLVLLDLKEQAHLMHYGSKVD